MREKEREREINFVIIRPTISYVFFSFVSKLTAFEVD